MTPTTIPRQHRPRRKPLRNVVSTEAGAIVLAAVVALAVGPALTPAPSTVDSVSIVNPSEYDVRVRVTGGDRDGWMALGTAEEEQTTAVADVTDQGARWVFRFTVGGHEGGELELSRDELGQASWTIELPDEVALQLRDDGAAPSP